MLDAHSRLFPGAAPRVLGVPAYTLFVSLGLAAGLAYYFIDLRRRGEVSEGAVKIVFSALICGVIGSKIPLLLEGRGWREVMYGKSIVGGLAGGMFGVIGIKRALGIKLKLGNVIAPSIALGMAIGRIGCFLNGCCFGAVASRGFWGFDFGDGKLRLPTQLFESAFHLSAFAVLIYFRNKALTPGILFRLYLLAYFIFRFLSEYIRVNPVVLLGMTIYQVICGLGIIYVLIVLWRTIRDGRKQQ